MTGNGGRTEILVLALLLSVAAHIGMMVYARPRVMTHVVPQAVRSAHRGAMKVSRETVTREEQVKLDVVKDEEARKEAPKEEPDNSLPEAALPADAPSTIEKDVPALQPIADQTVPEAPATPDPIKFSAEAIRLDANLSAVVPVVKIEVPTLKGEAEAAPTAGTAMPLPQVAPTLTVPTAVPDFSGSAALGKVLPKEIEKQVAGDEEKDAFVPIEEIMEKVDEKIVEAEKAAVRELVEAQDAEELAKYVDVALAAQTDGGWTYFKVMVNPRSDLKIIAKDVVVLIDASGSIGVDRMKSIRSTAKRVLRSVTNTGDRFNLVAFRDKYTYAFRSWQTCTTAAFDASDRWLDALAPHGRTDVFDSIRSVLTLPRDPKRPLIALVVTDGEANAGVRDTAEILSRFTALNDGLISVYMYGVKSSANRALIDVLTHGNRGESLIFDGLFKWNAGKGIETLSERFRDPVLSDIRVVFASGVEAETYPRVLRNVYRGGVLEFFGRVPAGTKEVAFSVKGLNGANAFESFFSFPLNSVAADPSVAAAWQAEKGIDARLR